MRPVPQAEKEDWHMILTTTPTVEGHSILEYKGIVFGEVIAGIDALKDIAAGFTNFLAAVPAAMRKS